MFKAASHTGLSCGGWKVVEELSNIGKSLTFLLQSWLRLFSCNVFSRDIIYYTEFLQQNDES